MSIVELLIVGLIVGAIARLLVPGRQGLGILGTLAIGVAGSFLGWFIGRELVGPRVSQHPWLWAIGGAVLLVVLLGAIASRRPLIRSRW
ncbi:MAG: GlsB/YeaQ/YmgE family stress response membrane protein [Actinomycetota bacterium]